MFAWCDHFSTLNHMSASKLKPLGALINGMALKDRIKEAQGSMSKAQFARELGVTGASVTQWLDGTTKSLKGPVAVKMERLTGYRAEWIVSGRLPKKAENVEQGPDVRGTVPLLSDVQAGMYREFVDNFHPGDGGIEAVPTTVPINQHTFALRVVGDSMEPRFTAGMILIVEPEMEANPGDFVIAKNGDEETTFKQLIKDGADFYLKPLNERYPIKPLGDSKIIGVVRAATLSFR